MTYTPANFGVMTYSPLHRNPELESDLPLYQPGATTRNTGVTSAVCRHQDPAGEIARRVVADVSQADVDAQCTGQTVPMRRSLSCRHAY
jgi:hypothetical protein